VNTPRSDEDRLKLIELMVFLLQKGVCDEIRITDARLSSYCCQANKSDAAEGFKQIIDFLNGSYIHYALTVNPHIYISCIKQFWNTASVKCSSDVTRVRKGFSRVETPLFEGMLVAIQLPEEGLVADQVHVDAAVAAAVEETVAENLAHDAIPSPPPHDIPSPSHEPSSHPQQQQTRVKKLEKANKFKSSKLRSLRKVWASRRVESSADMEDVFNQGRMFDDMDMDEGIDLVKDAEVAESEGRNAAEHAEKQAEIYNLDMDHSSKVLSMQKDDSEVPEVVEVVTTAKLITEVVIVAASQVSTASTTIPAASATIPAAKPTITAAALTVVAAYTRRRKGVIIRDPEEELSLKTPAETPKMKDKGKGILVEPPKPMKKKDQIEMDAEYAKKL
nr:hypothetical protein [Tanacetum cinerariifolium]